MLAVFCSNQLVGQKWYVWYAFPQWLIMWASFRAFTASVIWASSLENCYSNPLPMKRIFLEKLEVLSKTEQKVQREHIPTAPTLIASLDHWPPTAERCTGSSQWLFTGTWPPNACGVLWVHPQSCITCGFCVKWLIFITRVSHRVVSLPRKYCAPSFHSSQPSGSVDMDFSTVFQFCLFQNVTRWESCCKTFPGCGLLFSNGHLFLHIFLCLNSRFLVLNYNSSLVWTTWQDAAFKTSAIWM